MGSIPRVEKREILADWCMRFSRLPEREFDRFVDNVMEFTEEFVFVALDNPGPTKPSRDLADLPSIP